MWRVLLLLCLLSSSSPLWAQEKQEKKEPSPEALKMALQRSREATARCEDNLADLWAQAMDLKKQYDALQTSSTQPTQSGQPGQPGREKPQ